jgi:SAM-dependent methyltransferase
MDKKISELISEFKQIDYDKIRPKEFLIRELEYSKKAAENVKNKNGYQIVKNCDICNYTKFIKLIKKNNINIMECKNCGLVFSELIPVNINDVYSNQAYLTETIEAIDKESLYRKERFGKERLKILLKYKKRGKLLDIGCGTGWFIELAKEYFNCFGVEYSDDLIKYLIEKNINVYKDIDDVKNKYDLITLFDLIEHVPSPRKMLKNIYDNLINDDGIILLFTPNYNSISFYKLGKQCSLLTPPAHLYYYTPLCFKRLAEDVGFIVENIEIAGIDIGDLYAQQLNIGNEETAKFLDDNQNWLQYSIDKSGIGNHMRIILRKH